ncbi:MAG: GNAT family N-acetyltransferase [Thermodesulfobacteriota bacterium]|nr:GNAT family N-acetyltransferase [Thermodesulfobacteriota bacterium]
MIKWKVHYVNRLSSEFKQEISALWKTDCSRNPFTAPSFMEVMTKKILSLNETIIFAKGYGKNGRLVALWTFRLDKNKQLRFLQYHYCDYAASLHNPHVTSHELSRGVAELVRQVAPRAIVLDSIPEWGKTLESAVKGIKSAGYRIKVFSFDSAPVLEGSPGPEGSQVLKKKLNRRKSLKNYTNRMKRQKGFLFEIDQTGRNIDQWVEQFCDAHISRWKNTLTPSKYENSKARDDLREVLRAWADDHLLVRFSIRLFSEPITFVAGLKAGNTLIYFHTARRSVLSKLGPGNITIQLMGFWMIENGYHSLDFGRGDEPYKHYFANQNRKLYRIYASRSLFSLSYAKGCVEDYIRKKEARMKIWNMIGRSLVKTEWMARIKNR